MVALCSLHNFGCSVPLVYYVGGALNPNLGPDWSHWYCNPKYNAPGSLPQITTPYFPPGASTSFQ